MNDMDNNAMYRLRHDILGMSRAKAAQELGIPAHTIDNIERRRVELSRTAAKIIEASTGCSSSSLLAGENPLKTVRGEDFSMATYTDWLANGVGNFTRERTMNDMITRVRLLLKAAADHSPALYRTTLFKMRGALESVRANTDISFSQIRSAARASAKSQDCELSLDELDAKLKVYPEYQSERGNLDPDKKIKVRVDRFHTWDEFLDSMLSDGIADPLKMPTTTQEIWRIEKKDHQWFEVVRNEISGDFLI